MTTSSSESAEAPVRSDIAARLDRLPWARWHVMVLVGLGSVWILDGLEDIAAPLSTRAASA